MLPERGQRVIGAHGVLEGPLSPDSNRSTSNICSSEEEPSLVPNPAGEYFKRPQSDPEVTPKSPKVTLTSEPKVTSKRPQSEHKVIPK